VVFSHVETKEADSGQADKTKELMPRHFTESQPVFVVFTDVYVPDFLGGALLYLD